MNQPELSASASRGRRIVTTLSVDYPSRHGSRPDVLLASADFVEKELSALGYTVESQAYDSHGVRVRNLEVQKKGRNSSRPSIVIGAHYDTVLGTPGADDNATGIAGLIELARQLKGYSSNHTIRMVAFPHEEPPYFYTHLMGSRQYARQLREKRENVLVMLSLEMLGYAGPEYKQIYPAPLMRLIGRYPKYGDFIALVGNVRSLAMMSVVRRAMRERCKIGVETLSAPGFIPPLFLSDHSSFWKAGYPALMVTDTAFLRNPHYHRESDTVETLNFEFFAEVVDGVYAAVLSLDQLL